MLVLDTCVLISNVLRRALLHLAAQDCFEPVWSLVIGDEWRRNAARLWGVDERDILLQWEALQQAFPQADQGDVSAFKTGVQYSDPKDWHVIAAARAVLSQRPGVTVGIVTRNLRDFTRSELRRLNIELLDPDRLMVRCHAQFPQLVAAMLEQLPEYAMAPGRPPASIEAILKRERLFRFNKVCACLP